MLDEQRQVARAVAQRRQVDGEDVEPVEEVLAQPAGGHRRPRLLVARRHHPDVEGVFGGAGQPAHLAVLQHPQQLRLQLGRHLGDLVEQQGAAVGQLEAAAAQPGGAGERPLLVAEQLALHQLAGDGGGVDRR